jgi:hypothetical protein
MIPARSIMGEMVFHAGWCSKSNFRKFRENIDHE